MYDVEVQQMYCFVLDILQVVYEFPSSVVLIVGVSESTRATEQSAEQIDIQMLPPQG